MKFYDAVYHIAESKGITASKLSIDLGHIPTYIGNSKSRGSVPKVDTASAILKACGYKLCAVPKDNVPDSAILIENSEKESL